MIIIKKLKKSYGKNIVLDNINLKINKGDFVGIMGESGIGKSTLLNIISLLEIPDEGEYIFNNKKINMKNKNNHAYIRNKHMGFIFQAYNLLDKYTASDNIALPLLYSKKNNISNINYLFDKLNIRHLKNERVDHLSGGEKQRVAIARALITNPDIIICDEPTGNLDEKNSIFTMNILKDLNQKGKTIIFVTHNKNLDTYFNRTINLKDSFCYEN